MEPIEPVALVTGGGSGIGKAVAVRLEADGWLVYACSRSLEDRPAGRNAMGQARLDVTVPESVRTVLDSVLKRHGRIDALVNAAGVGCIGPIADCSDEDVSRILDANLAGIIRMCRGVIPSMRTNGQGRIINIGSLAGRLGVPYQGLYSASKAALSVLTESMDLELEPLGIRVVLIEPGDYKTGFSGSKPVRWPVQGESEARRKASVLACIERDATNANDVAELVDLVDKVLAGGRKGKRFVLGPFSQVASCLIRPFLPARAFRYMVKRHFGLT